MPATTQVELADRLSRKRALFTLGMAILFIALQFVAAPHYAVQSGDGVARRWGWVIYVVVLLANLATGGGLALGQGLRALINDEISRRNRAAALVAGCWTAMAVALGLYGALLGGAIDISAMQALHIVVSASVAIALLAFAALELRAHHHA